MLETMLLGLGVMGTGLLFAWAFKALANPSNSLIILIPLILPAVLWFALSGQLSELKGPVGFYVKFAEAANYPVSSLAERDEFPSSEHIQEPALEEIPIEAQMQEPVPQIEMPPNTMALVPHRPLYAEADAITRGERSGREIFWFEFGNLEAFVAWLDDDMRIEDLVLNGRRQFIVFGPSIGEITCYLTDTDLINKTADLRETFQELVSDPNTARSSITTSSLCIKPLKENTTSIEALRHMTDARHDEAIVVDQDSRYVGLIYLNVIVGRLLEALSGSSK